MRKNEEKKKRKESRMDRRKKGESTREEKKEILNIGYRRVHKCLKTNCVNFDLKHLRVCLNLNMASYF